MATDKGRATIRTDWSPSQDGNNEPPPLKMTGRISEIMLHTTLLVLPMVIFSAVLLGLVFSNRVEYNPSGLDECGSAGKVDEAGIFYVDFSATRLIFIASWSSSLAPILVGSVVVLISYPMARRIIVSNEVENTAKLPIPFQLSLMLRMLSGGGFGALWE